MHLPREFEGHARDEHGQHHSSTHDLQALCARPEATVATRRRTPAGRRRSLEDDEEHEAHEREADDEDARRDDLVAAVRELVDTRQADRHRREAHDLSQRVGDDGVFRHGGLAEPVEPRHAGERVGLLGLTPEGAVPRLVVPRAQHLDPRLAQPLRREHGGLIEGREADAAVGALGAARAARDALGAHALGDGEGGLGRQRGLLHGLVARGAEHDDVAAPGRRRERDARHGLRRRGDGARGLDGDGRLDAHLGAALLAGDHQRGAVEAELLEADQPLALGTEELHDGDPTPPVG